MREGGTKVKVEPGKRPWFQKVHSIPRNKAKTPGLEHQVFRVSGTKEEAEFVDVKKCEELWVRSGCPFQAQQQHCPDSH